MSAPPTVTVAIPTLNEERHVAACINSVTRQLYAGNLEFLVVDGGSTDATRTIVAEYSGVRLLDNPRTSQAAALNIAMNAAAGEIFVRIDGHSTIAPDYVDRCVETLERTHAGMVGGGVYPVARGGWIQRAIAAATVSPVGAGPAAFRMGGPSRWVDTVFLSAFHTALGRELGGYNEDELVAEDAEFAYRMRSRGGVWYEAALQSTYVPRDSLQALVRQYFRYGKLRAATVRRHPRSLAPRQLAAPAFVLSMLTPWRRQVLVAYGVLLSAVAARELRRDPAASVGLVMALPCMHVPWGVGFLLELATGSRVRPEVSDPSRSAEVHDIPVEERSNGAGAAMTGAMSH